MVKPCFLFTGLLTPNGILIEANQAALDFSGLMSEDVINHPFWEVRWWTVSPATQNKLRQAIAQAAAGDLVRYTVNIRGIGDTILTIDFSLKPITDDANRIVLLVAEAFDVRDSLRREAVLRQSEASSRTLLAAFPDILLQVQRDGSCLDLIPSIALETLTFVTIEKKLSEILSPSLVDDQLQRIAQTLATGEPQVWEQQRLKEGKPCIEEVRMLPCGDEEVLAIVRDVTARKQSEEIKLQAVIARNMVEGVCLMRAEDMLIVYANPKYEQMFGYETGELINQPMSIVSYVDANNSLQAINQALWASVLRRGDESYESHNVKKDGTPFWCQTTTSLFEHPEYGTVMVAMQQDITERKQAQDDLRTSLQEKEVLLQEIHHRIKNNLSIVDGLLQMQSRRSQSAEVTGTLQECQNRIASIALVHEKLYSSDTLAAIDLTRYVTDLTARLLDSYNIRGSQITLTAQVDTVLVDIIAAAI